MLPFANDRICLRQGIIVVFAIEHTDGTIKPIVASVGTNGYRLVIIGNSASIIFLAYTRNGTKIVENINIRIKRYSL